MIVEVPMLACTKCRKELRCHAAKDAEAFVFVGDPDCDSCSKPVTIPWSVLQARSEAPKIIQAPANVIVN